MFGQLRSTRFSVAAWIIAATPLAAFSSPVTVPDGGFKKFDFDATGVGSYDSLRIVSGLQGPANSRGYFGYNLGAVGALTISEYPISCHGALIYCGELVVNKGFLDGKFSFAVQSTSYSFSVDPYAIIYGTLGSSAPIYLAPITSGAITGPHITGAVPEPSTWALAALGLTAVLFKRRSARRAKWIAALG